MHFAWRVYFPPHYEQIIKYNSGGFSSAMSSDAREFIARLRFREDETGWINLYTHFAGGSSRSSIGDEALARFLHGRWDKLVVEQLGLGEVAVIDPDQPAVFLRVSMPEEMQAEARKTLPAHDQARQVPTIFEMKLEPEKKPKP